MAGDEENKYEEVRQKIIDMMKIDLMGPSSENEVLNDPPHSTYIIGMLASQPYNNGVADEQEFDPDMSSEDPEYISGEDDDNEPVSVAKYQEPTSIGISFYVGSSTPDVCIDVEWGDYARREKESDNDNNGNPYGGYVRCPMKETRIIHFDDFENGMDYPLIIDPKVSLHISKIKLKNNYSLVSVYVVNKRDVAEDMTASYMFQVNIKAYSPDGTDIFVAESICRDISKKDEIYYENRPIFGRGRGCAVAWGPEKDGKTSWIESDFIPQYELPNVSSELAEFEKDYFSTSFFSVEGNKNEILIRLNYLADTYEKWIRETLAADPRMADPGFKDKVGDETIEKCYRALSRIRNGITILSDEDNAEPFEAFCFMNQVIYLQNGIKNYAKAHGAGVKCSFADFTNPPNEENDFAWRPFQIAFILMNLSAIVDPLNEDREIVDLLYFPTGGGKTEAYLGLMAFVIANRRLHSGDEGEMNRDGGVTIILRYTLRLLTTQQRDRITRMIMAAEIIRCSEYPKYGKEPISIGFWVGSGVTPNKFKDMDEDQGDPEKTREAGRKKQLIYKQLPTCPFCGKPLKEDDFNIDIDNKSVDVYCEDQDCMFYKYRSHDRHKIPVYLVDEEIYARCPTVILSTVDKFANLPWTVETNALFGRVNQYSSKYGYIAMGSEPGMHADSSIMEVNPFLPPELIVQDELHLITGPLGTIYGAYETLVEDLCSYTLDGRTVKPKYVVSTATITNADEQAKCLYARQQTEQFPPDGYDISDSFFIREVPVTERPFRKYIGISAPGRSVKTTLLRTYAILLQYVGDLSQDREYKDFTDPYYTLVGYFNSIKELGGVVRLLNDDIPKRIRQIKNKYDMKQCRFLHHKVEITSRIPSYKIPVRLQQLEVTNQSSDCLDTAIATNMISVGLDIDRLGLMVVDGQPKQNSEYIQATSRIGRKYPGLVITVYNPYRPRDMSHYENFTGYHAQLYRYVEGTTATPFSARARDRVLHALVITEMRLRYPEMAPNSGAANIKDFPRDQIQEVENRILDRMRIVKPDKKANNDAKEEMDIFIDNWKEWEDLAEEQGKSLRYYVYTTEYYNRLMNYYGRRMQDNEKATLSSMRDVEESANMYYYTED